MARWVVGSIPHGGPIELFLIPTTGVIGCGMCYPVCGKMHIKEPVQIIRKSSPCDGSGGYLSRYMNGPLTYV